MTALRQTLGGGVWTLTSITVLRGSIHLNYLQHLLSVEDKADAAAQSLGWQHNCLSRIRIANTSA